MTDVRERLHKPPQPHVPACRMHVLRDHDVVDEVVHYGGPILFGYEAEGQRQHIGGLGFTFIGVGLGVEEAVVKVGRGLLGQIGEIRFIFRLAQQPREPGHDRAVFIVIGRRDQWPGRGPHVTMLLAGNAGQVAQPAAAIHGVSVGEISVVVSVNGVIIFVVVSHRGAVLFVQVIQVIVALLIPAHKEHPLFHAVVVFFHHSLVAKEVVQKLREKNNRNVDYQASTVEILSSSPPYGHRFGYMAVGELIVPHIFQKLSIKRRRSPVVGVHFRVGGIGQPTTPLVTIGIERKALRIGTLTPTYGVVDPIDQGIGTTEASDGLYVAVNNQPLEIV